MAEAIIDTAHWRRDLGVQKISHTEINSMIRAGLVYINGLDVLKRPIIYVSVAGNTFNKEANSADRFMKALVYTVER